MTVETVEAVEQVYGKCGECKKWVPRESMSGADFTWFDNVNRRKAIKLRLCPDCLAEVVKYYEEMEWNGVVLSGDEIKKRGEPVQTTFDFTKTEIAESRRK
ncbi:MAG: hypothetical protein DRN81_03030 [Thermoproteota archaeon]|nr:MAG: hypothetical protein DRN81_03030 [Candidatus Korarchaeota archaeon]